MAGNDAETASGPSKSFMTVGPTLHYSHANVMNHWWLAVAVYVITCLFWSWMLTGNALDIDSNGMVKFDPWDLGRFVVSPISIYEYPWYIVVLGLLMGILSIAPLLISQLLSFRFSIPMLLAVALIAKLPLFAVFLLVSCIAIASRPLRFRSRFISVAMCMSPQLIYWAIFGSAHDVDPIKWGFSFAPWVCAWLTGLIITGAVLGIGHFTRYKPGQVFTFTLIVLGTAIYAFDDAISFAELDYQLYVKKNNPEEVSEFHDHSMTEAIDRAISDPSTRSYLKGLFYPAEPILLRKDLKSEIQNQLSYDRWPNWFLNILPEEFKYQEKRQWLIEQYDKFITKWPRSKRTPIALYYKAMLHEYKPDIRRLGQDPQEVLHFYSDYPHHETRVIWFELYDKWPESRESLEARLRLAIHLAGQGEFNKAMELCRDAKERIDKQLELMQSTPPAEESLLTAFSDPSKTIMTPFKLTELKSRLSEFEILISEQNRTDTDQSRNRLAIFVLLNPYGKDYEANLNNLFQKMQEGDPLRDNVLLAKVMLNTDSQLKAAELKSLSETYANTDGGVRALYELGLLKVSLWKSPQAEAEEKKKYLAEARGILTSFIELYPKSIFSEEARNMLASLPSSD